VGKPPRLSQVEMTELVLPNDTNLLGNLLGGRLMHWIDIAGAMAASRHSNRIWQQLHWTAWISDIPHAWESL